MLLLYFGGKFKLIENLNTSREHHRMHRREATVPGPSPGSHYNPAGAAGNVGSSPEGGEGESDFVMVPEHLTMDAAEVR